MTFCQRYVFATLDHEIVSHRWRCRELSHVLSTFDGDHPLATSSGWLAFTLHSGTDNNLAHINIGRLLDRERHRAGDRLRQQRELVSGAFELRFHLRICHSFREVRVDKPGEMIVTRSLSPASCRNPSEMARTANFVAE